MTHEVEALRKELRKYRDSRELTNDNLARLIGPITGGGVRAFILGISKPNPSTLHVVREFLRGQAA